MSYTIQEYIQQAQEEDGCWVTKKSFLTQTTTRNNERALNSNQLVHYQYSLSVSDT